MTALLMAGYVVGWVLATATAGPALIDEHRRWMKRNDWIFASLSAMTWPLWVIALPFLIVGWLASKIGGQR